MDKLYEFSWAEQWLLFKTALLMAVVRLTLGLLPFVVVHRLFTSVDRKVQQPTAPAQPVVQQVIWAVKVIGRRLPGVTCLVEAYTLHYLLLHQGLTTDLRIGVIRTPQKQLEAHAWVERCGEVLIGDLPNLHEYTALPALGSAPA